MNKFALTVAALISSCAPVAACAPALNATAVAYADELVACVSKADTRAEAETCQAAVRRRYGRDDGGVK